MITTQKIGQHASVTKDLTGLNNLLAGIDEHYFVRIGILGNKAHSKHRKEAGELRKRGGGHKIGEKESEETNADIGLKMEKGSKAERIPPRSWLVTPLEDHVPEHLNKIGKAAIELILIKRSLQGYIELQVACEQIIQKGFETGGYGKWKSLSDFTIAQKGSSAILIDTGQLRKSVTSEIRTK